MNHQFIIDELDRHHSLFKTLLSNPPLELIHWHPNPNHWCLLEVVCHLHDEEREDFRYRVKHVLQQPNEPMPSIDPAGWVESRRYKEQNYQQMLSALLEERKTSVKWLRNLEQPAWKNIYQHPHFGALSAEFFLANWLAHDLLHIRQINRIKYAWLQQQSQQDLTYAGNW